MVCAPSCICVNDVDIEDDNGTCHNPCDLYKCENNGNCIPDISQPLKFRCNCTEEFEGKLCEKYHNFCLDPQPSFCPHGEYTCFMNGFRNYTCECSKGFFYNVTEKNCVKVGQHVNITMYFKDTPYSEIFNNITYKEALLARQLIQSAFEKLYGDNLIKLVFNNFTQGSLVAHLELLLKLDSTGAFRTNERILKQFLLDCDTKNIQCFGNLGNAFLPYEGWIATDERCGNVICPEHTICEPIDGNLGKTQCVCKDGFDRIGAVMDEQNRIVQICRDINECDLNPCDTVEECLNTPGSFLCGGIPANATCPEGSIIVVTGPFSYRCECSWIYSGTECRFPLTLILLILACIFLLTTIVAVVVALFRTQRNRTGTYQLYTVPNGMETLSGHLLERLTPHGLDSILYEYSLDSSKYRMNCFHC
ncbi:EGF-like domain protein [Dictyocaulus viviparus]|uniref:EGF-like domain protein n=1 Tax=Dictyocaulus viviparus TaxID=29172 RepID=A0A0D8XVN4_DICVI|nr:EGF-like domain protein [Dictyocaulus viviparus]